MDDMLCSNHEKIVPGSKIRYQFWSRKAKTACKLYVESGETTYSRNHFKGRKPKTFRDMKVTKVDNSLVDM
jgi:hypothetical protein